MPRWGITGGSGSGSGSGSGGGSGGGPGVVNWEDFDLGLADFDLGLAGSGTVVFGHKQGCFLASSPVRDTLGAPAS